MQPTVFIGHTPNDERYSRKIIKWASQGKLGDRVRAISLDDDRFFDNNEDLDRGKVKMALKEATLVVILIGEDNWDHPWLDFEGEFCHQWGIKRVLMCIPYTDGGLPEPFQVLREIAYNPNAVEKELQSLIETNNYY